MIEQLQKVFRSVFRDEQLIINDNTTAKDIKMWDSLTHLELIVSIEKEFGIQFSFTEVMQFDRVGDILRAIEKSNKPA